VLWEVLSPYPARLLVKGDELIQWDDDGLARKSSYGKTPIFRALSSIFLAMFQGRVEVLRDTFDLSATQDGATWRLDLTPKDEILGAAVSQVRVSGGRHVEEISILEPRGDRTLIRFSNPRIESCKLNDVEKTFFAS
jgi:outer membrane lipoprotein carrier protein LolA